MKRIVACIITFSLFVMTLFVLFSCQEKESTSTGGNGTEHTENGGNTIVDTSVTLGTETYRGFILDNVYHSEKDGDIHFNLYVPESYDGSKPYALYISLCGYGGYYFQGVGVNLRQESFVFEAQKYNAEMIIVAPQLNDWGNTSANQTIALTEYFLSAYNIDKTKVFMNGQDVYAQNEDQLAIFRRREVGLIYQFYNLIPVFDVVENMTLPVLMDGRKVNEERLEELLGTLGLKERRKNLPNQLSGGQQQRVSIGRALMNAPAVVLADEPTGNLDSKNSQEIVELLRISNRKYGQTLIVITHDENIALQADRVIAIEDGKIVRDERIRVR